MVIRGAYISKRKGAKKGTKKKTGDTFSRKEWFDLTVPYFNKVVGKTMVTRATQRQNVEKLLINRCFTVNQGDLADNGLPYNKFSFIVTAVSGRAAISSFNGFELTTDKARGLIRKWHTLIEGDVLVKTKDEYLLRVFVMAMSKRGKGDQRAKIYLTSTMEKKIRAEMFEIVKEKVEKASIIEVMKILSEQEIGGEIDARCGEKFAPLQNCYVKKVMVVKRPKLDEVEETDKEVGGEFAKEQVDEPGAFVPPEEEENNAEWNDD